MSRASATPTRPRRDVATTGLAVIVLVPGFAFSFLLSWSIGAARSDELLLAASVLFTIPMVAIFFAFQRYFMEGVTHTGIKG